MSELLTILEKFGIGAITVYMMFRLEDRILELTEKITELCKSLG